VNVVKSIEYTFYSFTEARMHWIKKNSTKARDAYHTFMWDGKKAANSEILVIISSRC
jgi:hypothetical protein